MTDEDNAYFIFGEAERRLRKHKPGSLRLLYDGVVKYLKQGGQVPEDTLLLLLEEMGPPKLTAKQQEKVDLFRFVEAVQAFAFVPDVEGELPKHPPEKLHAACYRVHTLLEHRDREDLSSYERRVRTGKPEDFYKAMSAMKKGRDRVK